MDEDLLSRGVDVLDDLVGRCARLGEDAAEGRCGGGGELCAGHGAGDIRECRLGLTEDAGRVNGGQKLVRDGRSQEDRANIWCAQRDGAGAGVEGQKRRSMRGLS